VGVRRSQWIVTFLHSKRSYLAADGDRELITSIKAVSASGAVIKLILILPGKVYLERFYHDLQKDVLVGLSESGYSNDELAYEYIHYFKRQSRKY
jgi:hypothetical protein